jgi:hypothetical protein
MPLDEQSAFADPPVFHQQPVRSAPNGEHPPWGLEDFHAYLPEHKYIFTPTRGMWPAQSVNALIPPVPLVRDGSPVLDDNGKPKMQSASGWLDQNRAVQQMSWVPGLSEVIHDKLIADGGWIERSGAKLFNLYRPPSIIPGDPTCASPWVELVQKVFPEDSDHIIKYFAHRVQQPHQKINHALVLGGVPGIGKDSILEPVKRAVGPWNFSEPSPQQVMGRFNGFVKSIIMRVSEARDLGEFDRYKFYEHMKDYTAAPPDVLRVDEKYMPEHTVLNVAGVIITTNHKTDGMYLPADDRRHYVAWSALTKEDFVKEYWENLWDWYDHGGDRHVAGFLAALDLSNFNSKAPPLKTPAFWEIVEAGDTPEDAELADALDDLGNPPVVRLQQIILLRPGSSFADWLKDRKNARLIPHRFEKCGYVRVRNEGDASGLWKVSGKRQAIYGRNDIPLRKRYAAALKMARPGTEGREVSDF